MKLFGLYWIWLLLSLAHYSNAAQKLLTSSEKVTHEPGYCSMYDNCGKKSFFGAQLPCPANIKAVKPLGESKLLLNKICGDDFPTDRVCCSHDQLINLESNLKKVDPLISSCPACRTNFYDFFCKFTCSPDQSTFVKINKVGQSTDTHQDIITELTQYVDPEYASDFFDSCKNLKFSATNGYAMDLIGGGAKNYSDFLKFLGDEKPLLGGSPFQINFKYDLHDDNENLTLRSGNMKSCNDPDPKYKCACSDCPDSCPVLPDLKNTIKKCKIGILPCFSFSIIIIWAMLILVLGLYHMWLAKRKRITFAQLNNILENDIEETPPSSGTGYLYSVNQSKLITDFQNRIDKLHISHIKLIEFISSTFARIGYFCASFPALVISVCFASSIILSLGLLNLNLETNPINLWVSPDEPALHHLQYFEENFGEWFRIEQIFVSNRNQSEPILNWDNIEWWFSKELELQSFTNEEGKNLELGNYCYQPLENGACVIESFTQYFSGNIGFMNPSKWQSQLKSCAESPVNCLPPFQQPLKKNLLFSNESILDSQAFTVTILINKNLSNDEYTKEVIEYEHYLQQWIFDLQKEVPHLKIDFSTEVSLQEELAKSTNTDIKIVVISYLIMFLYASLALGGKIPTGIKLRNFVLTRFQLGLGGIIIILISVTSSAGVFSVLGIKSTLIIAEVIPFLVLAIGIDNIFLIVHELNYINENATTHKSLEFRILEALGNIGPSCLISAVLQVSMLLLATRVAMPAVRNFAFYSAGAVTFNFILQMTGFISFLSIDQRRLEDGRVDCLPWIQGSPENIQLAEEDDEESPQVVKSHFEYDFSGFIKHRYAPWLLKPLNKRKVLTIFLIWIGVSLSVIPGIKFGLDQRIALPQGSYLVDYFNSVYDYLNVGPPMFLVVKDLDITQREAQQEICGKFSTCNEYSIANVLEQEYKRANESSIAEPTSNWLDDFLNWLNPNLDQCCRLVKSPNNVFEEQKQFCKPTTPDRQCETCYLNHDPPYTPSMEGLPIGDEFMFYFNQWIQEPSDPCPLGGKAPYGNSIKVNPRINRISSSYFRTSHTPLRSQDDFIQAYRNSLRIVEEIESYTSSDNKEVFAFSPFYIFFVQYESIVRLTFNLLGVAMVIIWLIGYLLLGSITASTIMVVVVMLIIINIGGVLSLWSILLNAVTLVNLVICVGLAVEFTIHITRAYVNNEGAELDQDDELLFNGFMSTNQSPPSDNQSSNQNIKAFNALASIGGSVLTGITITKFIGISVLAFTKLKIFEVYYFRMWLSLVVIAALHALVLLPVMLSYCRTNHPKITT